MVLTADVAGFFISLNGYVEEPLPLALAMYESPTIQAAYLDTAPVIDGELGEIEWANATQVTGFLGVPGKTYSPRQGEVYFGWNETDFFLAYRSTFPAGTQAASMRALVLDRDGPVAADDSIELYLAPGSSNTLIQAVINSLGTIYDSDSGNVSWQGNWRTASHVDNAAGVWELELAISFADLGVPPPHSGEIWEFTVARTWRGLGQAFTSLTGAYGNDFGQLIFTSGQPVVRELALGNPIAGLTQGDIDVANADTQLRRVNISYQLMDENQVNISTGSKSLTYAMSAGDERIFGISSRLEETGLYGMRIEVNNAEANQLHHYRVLPFEARDTIRLEPFFALSSTNLAILADLAILAAEPATEPLRATFTVSEGNAVLATETVDLPPITPFPVYFTNLVTGPLTQELEITCVVDTASAGQREQRVSYRLPPVPEWYGAYSVPEDFVPLPWTPLVLATNDAPVDSWLHRYDFVFSPLPHQIWIGETPLLAGPVELIVETAAGSLEWDASGVTVDRQSDSEVTFSKCASLDGLDVRVVSDVEFDGFMETVITLTPSQPIDLHRVRLEFPLSDETARFFHVAGNWGEKLFGAVAQADQFVALDSERLYQWLGNDVMGLCWLTDSTLDWQTSGALRIGFDAESGRVTGYLQPWSSPQTLTEPLTIRIGMQATPTRPPANPPYRMHFSYNRDPGSLTMPIASNLDTILESAIPGTMNFPPAARYAEMISNWVGNAQQRDMKYLPYQYTDSGTETEGYQAYWGDWTTEFPPRLHQWRTPTARSCFNSSWSDYVCHTLDVMMGDFGADGMYLDGVMARECDRDELHGEECGEGKWPVFAAREHFKKLIRVAHLHKGSESVIIGHTSIATIAPLCGLLDVHLKGENYGAPLSYDDMTPEVIRAEFGRQWGPQTVVLPQLTKKEAIPTGRFLGALALNGIDSAASYILQEDRVSMFFPYWEIIDSFSIADATFMPYYSQALIAEASGRPVSLYAHSDGDRLLVVAANQTANSTTFSLQYNGLKTIDQAVERIADPDESLTVISDSVDIALDPWGFKLVEVLLTESP